VADTRSLLPSGYEALEPFVQDWAIEGAANRARRRSESTVAERAAFFAAAKDFAAPALKQLDEKPLAELEPREERLLNLMLTLAHVAMAVEIQGEVEPEHAKMREHMRFTRTHSDLEPAMGSGLAPEPAGGRAGT
jgi:hypothetical protein